MPVWPFLMAITAGLTLWGWRHNAWEIPALALVGYVGMRLVVNIAPNGYSEVIACTLWLLIATKMLQQGGAVSGFFYALSALTYPVALVFGFRIEYMGLSPIIAEIFAAVALLSIGGGIYGVAHSAGDMPRPLDWLFGHQTGLAPCQEKHSRDLSQNSQLSGNPIDRTPNVF